MDNRFIKYTSLETFNKIVNFNSVEEMWTNSVKEYKDSYAISDNGIHYTFNEVDSLVAQMRGTISKLCLKENDLIGILIPNSVNFLVSFLGITTLGLTAVLIPAQLDKMMVFGICMKYGLKALIVDDSLLDSTEIIKAKVPTFPLISPSSLSDPIPPVNVNGNTRACIMFTGGTTGRSKGAILSNKAIMQGVKFGCYGYYNVFNQKYFLVLPLTHVFGLIRNLLTSVYTGSEIHICHNNKNMFQEIAAFKPTIIVLVPALAEMALNLSKKFNRNMLGESLKTIVCGAAFVPPYLIEEYNKLGITLFPGYGLTESSNLVSGNPEPMYKPSSVGFIYPGIDYKFVDGELYLKGISMQDEYLLEQEENISSYEDGWFKTGDLGYIDEEGFLFITGRKKEIIVLSTGENISPSYLEAKFLEIDAIQDCLVYENEYGALELEVLLRDTITSNLNVDDVNQYVLEEISKINKKLPSYERITKTVFRTTDFVRTPSMKIARNKNGYIKK